MRQKRKQEEQKKRGAFLHKSFASLAPMLPLLLISLLALSSAVYAAFVGRGSAKGVLAQKQFFFSSNVLQESEATTYRTTQEILEIYIRNYDQVTNIANNFDMTYRITFTLKCEESISGYTVTDGNGNTKPITVEGSESPAVFEGVLHADTMDEQIYELKFPTGSTSENVFVTAEPIQPLYMKGYSLYSTVSKSREFNVNVALENVSGLRAGFKYTIECAGTLYDNTKNLRLKWNATYLQMDDNVLRKMNVVLNTNARPEGVENADDDDTYYAILLPLVDNDGNEQFRYFTVPFYRTDAWNDAPPVGSKVLVTASLYPMEETTP